MRAILLSRRALRVLVISAMLAFPLSLFGGAQAYEPVPYEYWSADGYGSSLKFLWWTQPVSFAFHVEAEEQIESNPSTSLVEDGSSLNWFWLKDPYHSLNFISTQVYTGEAVGVVEQPTYPRKACFWGFGSANGVGGYYFEACATDNGDQNEAFKGGYGPDWLEVHIYSGAGAGAADVSPTFGDTKFQIYSVQGKVNTLGEIVVNEYNCGLTGGAATSQICGE